MTGEININRRILETAREQFFNRGFTKVTTDEIAAELGMSKKTLYKFFPKKNKLLEEVLELTMLEVKKGAEEIIQDDSLEFTAKLERLFAFLGGKVSMLLRRPFLQDIQRNAPQIWHKIEKFRKEMIQSRFANLINEGVQKNELRCDVNPQLVTLIFFNAIQNIINPETLSNIPFTASEAFEAIIKTIFEGILTEDARKNYRSVEIK